MTELVRDLRDERVDLALDALALDAGRRVLEARPEDLRIELDAKRGGIKSMYDKTRRREWADRKSEHALGGFVYEYPRITKSSLDRYGGRMQIFRESDWSKFMAYGGWNANWPAVRKGMPVGKRWHWYKRLRMSDEQLATCVPVRPSFSRMKCTSRV